MMKSPNTNKFIQNLFSFLFAITIIIPSSYGQKSSAVGKSCTSLSITEKNNGERSIDIRKDGDNFNLQTKGYITLADDDKDIVAISGGGYLKISKSAFGSKRRLVIEADRSGQLIRKYVVGWREKDYEPEGREWLAEILPEIVRSSGVGAEDRVNRIYEKGGMQALADEVRLLDGDYVKTTYLQLAMCKKLTEPEIGQLLTLVGEEIKSDHHVSEILMENVEVFTETPSRIDAFVMATKSVSSDHYMTEILQEAITCTNVSDQQLSSLLRAAEGIQSDHYQAECLSAMLDRKRLSPANTTALVKVLRTINSDSYFTEVMGNAADCNDIHSVKVEEIACFAADGRVVTLFHQHNKKYVLDFTLTELETMLNPTIFFRVNRTFIVHINAIKDVVVYSNSRLKIVLNREQSKEIVVSREKVGTFKAWLAGG